MHASSDAFKAAMRNFASSVTIVTSIDVSGQPVGATVSAFSSVSADPPTVLVCLNGESRSAKAIHASGVFSVHILGRDQVDLALRFATDKSEKFPDASFTIGATGAPALLDCDVRLDCEVESDTVGGTHRVFVGRVKQIQLTNIDPLLYADRTFWELRALSAATAA